MTQSSTDDYPEHAKQNAVLTESQAIGEFLDTSEYIVAEYREIEGYLEPQLVPVNKPIQQILAEYFDIDLNAIEAEKRQMLADIASMND